jgi:hypothetical protein
LHFFYTKRLKDSDVTWLYGPLHTAVDWTPPPIPQPVSNSIDLNLRPCKPILKHRSISELIIANLIPTSPIFSPVESEDEDDTHNSSTSPTASSPSFLSFAAGTQSKRPTLIRTKSDTHITRWGGRAFRKDSPSWIDPPGFDAQNQRQTQENTPHLGGPTSQRSNSSPVESEDEDDTHNSSTSPTASSPSFLSFTTRTKSKRPTLIHTNSDTHITRKNSPLRIDPPGFDASKSQNQRQTLGPMSEPTSQSSSPSGEMVRSSSSGAERTKKKHISFNTYVQQYIAIEKPKKSTSGFFGASQERNWSTGSTTYPVDDG